MKSKKYHNLSILLLKDDFEDFDQVVQDDFRTKKFIIEDNSQAIGTLYVRSSIPNPPKWASLFDGFIEIENIGINTTVGAVLLTESEGKKFAVTFGHGRYLIKPDSWIERFGLKVALNSIGTNKIRTIDKSTFDSISRQSKEQASKETDARDFGLDIEQDLLRAVTGVPKSPALGKRIYGMDSLSVTTDIKIEQIDGLLKRIYAKYLDDSYKKEFPWVDHISGVKDKTAIGDLDALLFSHIASGKIERIWMAVPEIIEWDKVGGFCYKMSKTNPEFQDIHLPDFIDSLNESDRENPGKETFTKKFVYCIDSEGYLMHKWQAYKCLYCELEKGTETYLLNGGKWYVVEKDFVVSVNRAYAEIPNYEIKLPKYNDESEGKYNERVSQEMADHFVLMDKKNISYGGGHSKIEFSDLFSVDRDIIHVKRYGSSSVLIHLFAQGRLSGELFQMEKSFRRIVAGMMPDGFKIKNSDQRPKSDEYQIVYAIISDAPGELDIPFFSRLNLKNSARNLRGLGFRVAKLKIDVDEEKVKLKKYRQRKTKK
jgi:uncharacterized protein (TIGR04141 family)